jgi:hypothetical protein
MRKIKEYINKSYGSGVNTSCIFPIVFLAISIIIGCIGIFRFDPNKIDTDLPFMMNWIFKWYFVILTFDAGFLFLALFLYFKPKTKNTKDKTKVFKIIFAFLTILIFGILCLPLIIILLICKGIGKILKVENLSDNFISSLMALISWILISIFSLLILLYCCKTFLIDYINGTALLSYSMLLSLFISNKLSKIIFMKMVHIIINEEKEKTSQQVELFWSYILLAITVLIKPLEFNDESTKAIVDALFYSSASITLFSKVFDLRKKIK